MLSQLCLSNFALVDSLTLDFEDGLNVISGDSGAGKSLLLSALNLLLGERSGHDWVRTGSNKAELSASFDLSLMPGVLDWLTEHDLVEPALVENDPAKPQSQPQPECIIRRIIRVDGRSRAYINGIACPLSLLKELGHLMVEYHGQHQHTRLLDMDTQLAWFDRLVGAYSYRDTLSTAYRVWGDLERERADLEMKIDQGLKQRAYLEFQLKELEQVEEDLQELTHLESQLKLFQQQTQSTNLVHQALALLNGSSDINCSQCLSQVTHLLGSDQGCVFGSNSGSVKSIKEVSEMLTVADIHIQEAVKTLETYAQETTIDNGLYEQIEAQLSDIYRLARKHRVVPQGLLKLLYAFREELDSLEKLDGAKVALLHKIDHARRDYFEVAHKITSLREKGKQGFEKKIIRGLNRLGLEKVRFKVELKHQTESEHAFNRCSEKGLEQVSFLFSPNTGHALKPLYKTISGGELSRLSLVLQACAGQAMTGDCSRLRPVYIFDEVDVGVSGSVAEVMGEMLRDIGETAQVFCITHSAQVAAQGSHHWKAAKFENGKGVMTSDWSALDKRTRVQELARMLGGLKITQQTKRYAKEMLDTAHKKVA